MNRTFKWLLVIILTFHFSLLTSKAQGIQGKMIVGINLAQVDGDAMFGFNRIGPVVGGAANMKLGGKTSLQPEIYYSMKGAASTSLYSLAPSSILHYIDVPVIINYQLKKRWALQGGLSACFLINAQIGNGSFYGDYTNYFKKYDICFVFGAEFALSPEWGINLRYNYSALPINASNLSMRIPFYGGNLFNNYLNLTIRYTFIKRTPEAIKQ